MNKAETGIAPKAVGPYSHTVKAGELIFTSGQMPIDPKTGDIVCGGIEAQTKQIIENLSAVLSAAGSCLQNVVKTTCYLKDINDFAKFNEVYAKYFTCKPARSCVEVSALPKGALAEIDAVAYIK